MLRTLRQSFRRKKHSKRTETDRPPEWKQDEEGVKAAKCSFHVKYLGSIEVQESRGMHVCEQAVKQLKAEMRKKRIPHFFGRSKKRKIRAMLYVSPDALRVVEDSTKALLLDQTIEKVSFCAPDRNHERAFSYICRDGTTRRWLCHSFFALKESGERLSHAVGCAFAACLEKKQKREKETGVTVTYDRNRTTFTREGSFRVQTLTEQQEKANQLKSATDPSQVQVEVHHTSAVPRPHAPLHMLRQASMRAIVTKKGGDAVNTPFKRNYSVQVNKLPSTINRQNRPVMNPVPEVEEPNAASEVSPEKVNTFQTNNNDDPFAKAPMPLASPLIPKPANGFGETPKPTDLSLNNATRTVFNPTPFANSSSPVHPTNPWAADTQLQQPSLDGDRRPLTRKTSEAEQWLNSIEQQAGSMNDPSLRSYSYAVANSSKPVDPFTWKNGGGFEVT